MKCSTSSLYLHLMVFFPPCKINLGLRIIEKRSDGFHNIETCFYPVPWTDILEIIPSDSFEFTTSGLSVPGDAQSNLCVKAYRLLKSSYNLPPVKIHLHKILPMGAGLGGGSADAAYVLRGLNEIFGLQIQLPKLTEFASRIGSDCAFFLYDKPMIGNGKGEMLSDTTLTLKSKFIVIVKPPVHISTQSAYSGVTPDKISPLTRDVIEKTRVADWKRFLTNDFEKSIFMAYPQLADVKQRLYDNGAVYASMSGSGSSIFGIFDNAIDLKNQFADCEYWSGELVN